jgi:putative transposase
MNRTADCRVVQSSRNHGYHAIMSLYRRLYRPGGTYFFTVVTHERRRILLSPVARRSLREAMDECRKTRPFEMVAVVLLPDHLHCVWALPEGDDDFSRRWAAIKAGFSRRYLAQGSCEAGRCTSRIKRGERGLWQRRFWEHRIRDPDDLRRHTLYIHYNPVRHGLAICPHQWAPSSFHRFEAMDEEAPRRICICRDPAATPPPESDFTGLQIEHME